MIFPTLAFQLAHWHPAFRKELINVLKASPDVGQESLCYQMEELIVCPLKATHIPTLIIIDALDERKDEEPASAILSILSRCVNEIPNVKFFITGRPEPRIRSGFRLKSLLPITEVLKLHEVKHEVVNNDIKLFFQTQLTNLAENRSDCGSLGDWPSSSDIGILCKKAAGFFIYASTVIKFVASKSHKPTKRLNLIISLPESTSHEGRSGIDLLYTQVLEQAVDGIDADDDELHSCFRTVVGALLLIFNPLSTKALSDLLREFDISTTLCSLHSLLLVPDVEEDPILIFHKSFPDFLTDPKRCKDQRFLVEPPVHHPEITLSCLSLMKERMKRNICKLDDGTVLSEVKNISIHKKDHIGDALEYACCFWTKHLLKIPSGSPHVKEVQKAIDDFFKTYFLFWIEVLSLTGTLNIGVYALNDIQQWYMLVSYVWYTPLGDLYLHFSRWEFSISGEMMASVSSWNPLMQSLPPLPKYTILPSHSALLHLGFTSVIVQNSYKCPRWSRGFQLNGEHVPAQFHLATIQIGLHAGKILLQLGWDLGISPSLIESQVPRWLFSLGTIIM